MSLQRAPKCEVNSPDRKVPKRTLMLEIGRAFLQDWRMLTGHLSAESRGPFLQIGRYPKVTSGLNQQWRFKSGGSSGISSIFESTEGLKLGGKPRVTSGLNRQQDILIKTGGCSEDTSLCSFF